MSFRILGYSLGDEALSYIRIATISGATVLVIRNMDLPIASFALTILGALSSSQAAIHIGRENFWSNNGIKRFDLVGIGLAGFGTFAIPITVGWGVFAVLCEEEKIKYSCALIASLAAAKFLGIPEFP